MKMIKVKFANGREIEAPAIGKVLEKDLRISRKKREELFQKNFVDEKVICDINVDFDKIRDIEIANKRYYETLPKWFNYNRKGKIANKFKTKEEFFNAINKFRRGRK